jgi:hypothetical protein
MGKYEILADISDTEQLLASGYRLRREIRIMEERLKGINRRIIDKAVFDDGCDTGHVSAGNFKAKVCRRFTVRWDQDKLKTLRERWGSDLFFSVFRVKLEPIPYELRKLNKEQVVEADRTKIEKEGTPSVEVEYLGEIV